MSPFISSSSVIAVQLLFSEATHTTVCVWLYCTPVTVWSTSMTSNLIKECHWGYLLLTDPFLSCLARLSPGVPVPELEITLRLISKGISVFYFSVLTPTRSVRLQNMVQNMVFNKPKPIRLTGSLFAGTTKGFFHQQTWLDQNCCAEAVTGYQLQWKTVVSYIKKFWNPDMSPSKFWLTAYATKKQCELVSAEFRLVPFSSCQYMSL